MSLLLNNNQIKMTEEVKLFQRYLRLNKKLAFSKNWDKQKRIVDSTYGRDDYGVFDYINSKEILKDDFEVFNTYSNFDVESLESECIRKQIKMSLLDEMLKKKPHYAKFFTELEDEMEDR